MTGADGGRVDPGRLELPEDEFTQADWSCLRTSGPRQTILLDSTRLYWSWPRTSGPRQ